MAGAAGKFCMVFVTVPSREVAKSIAGGLLSEKLAACINVIPGVTSYYEWQGKMEEDQELLLMIKSTSAKFSELSEFVKSKHPYDCVEVISADIDQGNQPYLDWIEKSCTK
ncbi:hypothetical protein ACHWQZ_G017316 [Mnemiopsis leidyi]